ncbi:MAG: peptidoglycan-associated lipoprotein Pal [Thermoanaerobaculaceae bacterium]|nr:peptidoglycan-associated lipoprotein Pal [Thermoanaerobaculaceae bacterium]
MQRRRLIFVLILVFSLLLIMNGCKKKEAGPKTPPPAPAVSEQPSTGWTPEKQTEQLKVETTADYYNKQGVLKRIHFETNKWAILPEAREILKKNAEWIMAHPEFKLIIEGHCDERNTEAYNLALGERRANSAKEFLVGLGVPASKIQTVSYGENKPLCTDHNEECWQQNRRAEFLLTE